MEFQCIFALAMLYDIQTLHDPFVYFSIPILIIRFRLNRKISFTYYHHYPLDSSSISISHLQQFSCGDSQADSKLLLP